MIDGKILVGEDRKVLLPRVRKAESAMERTRGLLGCRSLADGEGLLIAPCNSIHTFFMHFPLDVIFLNRENSAVKIIRTLKPFRISMALRASSVLELMAGQVDRSGIQIGDKLIWDRQDV